jgi:pyruvate,orthophosphate dikinase
VQTGTLYLLQARAAKRAPAAAVRIAVDMVGEGAIDAATALTRVSAEQVCTLLLPTLDPAATATATVVGRGEGACPGGAVGVLVADPDEAERRAAAGEAVVLVRKTTSPDDVHGMIAARAVVTEQGGSTSHAAVVSRALGRPCVVGTGDGMVALAGQTVSVDGAAGLVYAGALPTQAPAEADSPQLRQLIDWARPVSTVRIVTPAEAEGLAFDNVDDALAVPEPDLAAIFGGRSAVGGSALANPEIARAAKAAGVKTIVTEPVLPALLAVSAA